MRARACRTEFFSATWRTRTIVPSLVCGPRLHHHHEIEPNHPYQIEIYVRRYKFVSEQDRCTPKRTRLGILMRIGWNVPALGALSKTGCGWNDNVPKPISGTTENQHGSFFFFQTEVLCVLSSNSGCLAPQTTHSTSPQWAAFSALNSTRFSPFDNHTPINKDPNCKLQEKSQLVCCAAKTPQSPSATTWILQNENSRRR